MPQKKKQFRFKIPWISGSRAPTQKPESLPPPSTQAQGTPKDEPQKQPPPHPPQSPASSEALESPVPSPSHSPSQPSTPSQDLSPSSSPSHAGSLSNMSSGPSTEVPPQPAAPSSSEQGNEKMNSPLKTITISPENETSPSEALKFTPKELELKKQSKTHQSDEAKEIAVTEKGPTNEAVKGIANGIKHGDSTQRSKTELQTTAPASTTAFHTNQRKIEAPESIERKMMFATSSSIAAGKEIKVMSSSSDPATTRNVSSTSISPDTNPLHQSSNKENHTPLQKAIKDDISNFVQKLATVTPTQPRMDEIENKNFSVVTLAGENRGATMHVGSNSAKKEGSIRIHRAYKTHPEESTDVSTDSSDEKSPKSSDEKDEMGKAYVNSNIQSVNNSLMVQGSVSERDPGVRLVLPQHEAEPIKKRLEVQRAEVSFNRGEKTSYQPVIRRRCLRGMFMEPSDDEPDNPNKPRRHGCKVRCGGEKGSDF